MGRPGQWVAQANGSPFEKPEIRMRLSHSIAGILMLATPCIFSPLLAQSLGELQTGGTSALEYRSAAKSVAPPNNDWFVAKVIGSCSGLDVDFHDAQHGFASCVGGRAMTTDDGGANWQTFDTGLGQSLVFAHSASSDDLYVARLGLYNSVDRGETWSEIGDLSSIGSSVFDVHFASDGRLVALQGGSVLNKENPDTAWEVVFEARPDTFVDELHFATQDIGYASGGSTTDLGSIGTVLRSADGGRSWSQLPFSYGQITASDFTDADHGIVSTLQSNIFATSDGGQSWRSIGVVPNEDILLDIVHRTATPSQLARSYAVSLQGCLYESMDLGASWQAVYCDSDQRGFSGLVARDDGPTVAVGAQGMVLMENRLFSTGFD
jgi:photosystem II stability/assembly factor-like uncharacterized protein